MDLPPLLENDIVITTYTTLAIEYAHDRSILYYIYWYRLVLDKSRLFHYLRRISVDDVNNFNSLRDKESFNKTVSSYLRCSGLY